MAGWSGMGAAARGAVLVAGAAVAVAGWYFGVRGGPDGAPAALDPPAQGQTAAGPAAAVPVGAGTAANPEAVTKAASDAAATASGPALVAAADSDTVAALPAATAILPQFDVARVAPDGAATVAGTAAPGAKVSLLVDGVAVGSAVADGQGKFAALFDVAPSSVARLLTVQTVGADGVPVAGAEKIALAPVVGAQETADLTKPAAQAPAAVLIAPEGVKVLQTGAQVPAETGGNVVVDSISYAPDGAVRLGGRAGAGAALRLYLDGAVQSDLVTGPDGAWTATLKDVAAGIYTLRVDQLAADGTVTSRFETPFKRETLEALAAASGSTAAPVAGSAGAQDLGTAAVLSAPDPVAAGAAAEANTQAEASGVAAAAKIAVADPAPSGPAALAAPDPAPADPAPVSVTVQPGYTLWGIAQQNFGDGVMYVQVFEANKDKIKNPDLIYPGQVFRIPAAP